MTETIKTDYTAECGKPANALLLTAAECLALRTRIGLQPYTGLWQEFSRDIQAIIAGGLPDYLGPNPDPSHPYGDLGWCSITPGAVEAAVCHAVTGDPGMLAHVCACVERLCQEWDRLRAEPERRAPVLSHGEVALAADLCRGSLPEACRQRFTELVRSSLLDSHAFDSVLTGVLCGFNTPICQNIQAGIVALTWGRESGRDDWGATADLAADTVLQALTHVFDPAGFSYEGTGYGHGVIWFLYWYAELYTRSGRGDLYARCPKLERLADASRLLLFPDRSSLVNISDKGIVRPHSMPWLLLAARRFQRPDLLGYWNEFQGPEHPQRPYGGRRSLLFGGLLHAVLWWDAAAPNQADREAPPLCFYSPGTETVCARTSWNRAAVFASFLGSGREFTTWDHAHADCGHLSVFAGGEYLAIDTGRYNVNEDQHSVVLVDDANARGITEGGWEPSRAGGRIRDFHTDSNLTYAMADASVQKDCLAAFRHFMFVPYGTDRAYIVLLDYINKDNAAHDFTWQLQVNHEFSAACTAADRAVVVGSSMCLDAGIVLPAADAASLKMSVEEKEWAWPYGRSQDTGRVIQEHKLWDTSLRRPRLSARFSAPHCRVLALLSPRPREEAPLNFTSIPHPRMCIARVELPAWNDTIYAAPENGYIKSDGISAFAPLALVRRNQAGDVIFTWAHGKKWQQPVMKSVQ